MTTSEPTTGELIQNARYCSGDDESCFTDEKDCGDFCLNPKDFRGDEGRWCRQWLIHDLADRLELLERENTRLMTENKALNDHVKVATGVAGRIDGYAPVTICGVPIDDAVKMLVEYPAIKEQLAEANARADAAVADIKVFAHTSHTCKFDCDMRDEGHDFCAECHAWEWRGAKERGKE